MARFTTRVQLDGYASEEHYDRLHQAMKRQGFSRFVRADNGKTYHLPHAEYDRTANLTITQISEDAKLAAQTVWDDFQILVTEGGWAGYGLKEASHSEVMAG